MELSLRQKQEAEFSQDEARIEKRKQFFDQAKQLGLAGDTMEEWRQAASKISDTRPAKHAAYKKVAGLATDYRTETRIIEADRKQRQGELDGNEARARQDLDRIGRYDAFLRATVDANHSEERRAKQHAISDVRSKLRLNEVDSAEWESKLAAASGKSVALPPSTGNVDADYANVLQYRQQQEERKAKASQRLDTLRSEREQLESQLRGLMTELDSIKAEALAA